jgi:hypothetical protein
MFNCFESVFQAVDDALESAAKTRNKKSKEADDKFNEAIKVLGDYEKRWHSKQIVVTRMEEAEAKDKSSFEISNIMKEKLRIKKVISSDHASHILILIDTGPQQSVEVPKRTVEFRIHKSLPDRNPTIVKSEPAC